MTRVRSGLFIGLPALLVLFAGLSVVPLGAQETADSSEETPQVRKSVIELEAPPREVPSREGDAKESAEQSQAEAGQQPARSDVRRQDRRNRTGNLRQAGSEYVLVRIQGKLQSSVAAIGGETTGTTVTADGMTFELDLRQQPALTRQAKELDGKIVTVGGRLQKKDGVEIKQRWIVAVRQLQPVGRSARRPAEGRSPDRQNRPRRETDRPLNSDAPTSDDASQLDTPFEFLVGDSSTRITAVPKESGVRFNIRSERGIGQALLRRKADAWPKDITLRLYLKGLESLTIEAEDATLKLAVANVGGKVKTMAESKQGDKPFRAVGEDSPLFTKSRVGSDEPRGENTEQGRDAESAADASGNYFEVDIPAPILTANPKAIQLQWIDFHRE